TKATYTYDVQGNRIYKVIERQGTINKEYTFYVRDAQGNVIATLAATSVATNLSDIPIQQQERFIYGSSRLGAYQYPVNLGNGPSSYQGVVSYAGWRNAKQYELTNHLGNV